MKAHGVAHGVDAEPAVQLVDGVGDALEVLLRGGWGQIDVVGQTPPSEALGGGSADEDVLHLVAG